MTTIKLEAIGFEQQYASNDRGTGLCVIALTMTFIDCTHHKTSFAKSAKFFCPELWRNTTVIVTSKTDAQSDISSSFVRRTLKFLYDFEMDRLGKKAK